MLLSLSKSKTLQCNDDMDIYFLYFSIDCFESNMFINRFRGRAYVMKTMMKKNKSMHMYLKIDIISAKNGGKLVEMVGNRQRIFGDFKF